MGIQVPAQQHDEAAHEPAANGKAPDASGMFAALTAYQAAMAELPQGKTDDAPRKVLQVVVAREQLAHKLAEAGPPNAEELDHIAALDCQLRAGAAGIVSVLAEDTFAHWRDTFQPQTQAWWWRLDEVAADADANAYPVLQFVASLLIVATSVSLTVEIARRFLAGSLQFIGVFTAVSSALLALLGGGAFTQVGHRNLGRVLARLHIRRRFMTVAKIGLALVLLLAIFAIDRLLPAFAVYFNNRAQDSQGAGQFASAINDYQLAISLNPDNPDPYYNQATAYEDVLDYAHAIESYQHVQSVAPASYFNLARAYNNLARLYIVYRGDAAGALQLVNDAFGFNPTQPDVLYALYKNRGWSLLQLKLLEPAAADLRQAITLNNSRPAAHCLLAKVFDAQGNAANALTEWNNCLAYATPDRTGEVEAEWLITARNRAQQGGAK